MIMFKNALQHSWWLMDLSTSVIQDCIPPRKTKMEPWKFLASTCWISGGRSAAKPPWLCRTLIWGIKACMYHMELTIWRCVEGQCLVSIGISLGPPGRDVTFDTYFWSFWIDKTYSLEAQVDWCGNVKLARYVHCQIVKCSLLRIWERHGEWQFRLGFSGKATLPFGGLHPGVLLSFASVAFMWGVIHVQFGVGIFCSCWVQKIRPRGMSHHYGFPAKSMSFLQKLAAESTQGIQRGKKSCREAGHTVAEMELQAMLKLQQRLDRDRSKGKDTVLMLDLWFSSQNSLWIL